MKKPTTLPKLPIRGWLQKGDKGDEVRKMQKILIYFGCPCGKAGADGKFQENTKKAVLKFQKKYKLSQDAGWGKECNAKAKKLLGLDPVTPQERGWWQKGDSGEEVKDIQRKLNQLNHVKKVDAAHRFGVLIPLKEDGVFGQLTEDAVKFFQFIEDIKTDGQVGKITMGKLNGQKWTGARGAVNFAVAVALNNGFAYGEGKRAHRTGCYFCGTNTGPKLKRKEKKGEPHEVKGKDGKMHTYTKTYCCNTFITAAYAHGAGDSVIYKICNKGSCCGMAPKDWTKSSHFTHVGKTKKVPAKNLKMGDVIMADEARGSKRHHVLMCIGHNRYVHASGNNWTAGSISVHGGLEATYEKYYGKYDGTDVCRYKD